MSRFIPVNEPLLDGNEKKYLNQCVDTGWISSDGPFVRQFEEAFSASVHRKHGIAVSNGTAAIDAAIEALDIRPGDEVILPAFTIISCVQQIVRIGATPIFIDADRLTWNMDIAQIESKITARTKAVMVVHIYGLPVDLDPVLEICQRNNLLLIEDAAEVIGQTYNGKPCGSFGDISTVSFYPNKHVTTGEGGMVLTNDDSLAEKCRALRNLCFKAERRFVHDELGWNLRMSNLQAAVGLAQFERLDAHIENKRAIGARYRANLSSVPELQLALHETSYATNVYWVNGVVLSDEACSAREIMSDLATRGVGTRPFFFPLHKQPVLQPFLTTQYSLPQSERLGEQGFYLPSGLTLTNEDIDYCSQQVIDVLRNRI